jgi:protein-arginine deiminase
MHKTPLLKRFLFAGSCVFVACGTPTASDTTTPGADASTADGTVAGGDVGADIGPLATPIVDLAVDANRDGVADLANPDDQAHGNAWTPEFGASYLANLDDDDGDKIEDVLDTVINGSDDELDLAPIAMAPWPDAPDGYVGVLQLDHPEKVRLWKKGAGDWEIVAGIDNDCVPTFASCTGDEDTCADTNHKAGILTASELRSGVKLAIEGRDFRRDDSWDGNVHVTMWVGLGTDAKVAPIPTKDHADGKDTVLLHVAPWILNGNTTPFDQVRSANYFSEFTADLNTALGAAGANVKYTKYNDGSSGGKWNDAWTQDYYQTAWTSIPQGKNADGSAKIQGMRVVNARPWGRYNTNACSAKLLPIVWLRANYLGKDHAVIAIYQVPNSGSSFDSHGNHDLLPAYENGQDKFPIGRIIHGSGILEETLQFYNIQGPQSPSLEVKTDWLLVGHVDEVLSYTPAKTDRGWKLLIASNNLSKQMLQKLVDDGHGSALLFEGKQKYQATGNNMVDAAQTVTATLADSDLMQWSQEAQAEADGVRKTVKDATGLTDAEIIEMPFLTEEVEGGKIAWQPGTANMLVVGNTMEIPNPFGPKVNGVDVFAQDLKDRLGTPLNALGKDGQGMKVFLIDDFEGYHINEGEVHCGTNPEGPPQPSMLWWLIKH